MMRWQYPDHESGMGSQVCRDSGASDARGEEGGRESITRCS